LKVKISVLIVELEAFRIRAGKQNVFLALLELSPLLKDSQAALAVLLDLPRSRLEANHVNHALEVSFLLNSAVRLVLDVILAVSMIERDPRFAKNVLLDFSRRILVIHLAALVAEARLPLEQGHLHAIFVLEANTVME
jgi:hypothetical protein